MNAIEIEATYERRTVTVVVQNVKVGDGLAQTDTRWAVQEVKVGRKWVYIKAEKAGRPDVAKTFEFELDTQVSVERSFETEESQTARTAERVESWYQSIIDSFEPEAPAVLAKLTDEAGKGYAPSSFTMTALIQAQATDLVMGRYIAFVAQGKEHGKTVTETRELFKASCMERIVRFASSGTSRSTSQMSNLMEDAEAEALARFCNGY